MKTFIIDRFSRENIPAHKIYRLNNPEKYKAIDAKYKKSAKGRAANSRACRKYRLNNLEFYKQLHTQRRVRKLLGESK